MPKFMKTLNNISRSQAVYRNRQITAPDLNSGQYSFVLAICAEPGRSQEELARELCLNKSTVARALGSLEEKGYIERIPLKSDKRTFSVYPTDKMLSVLPEVKRVSGEWMDMLSEGISEGELEVFNSVLLRMQEKARAIVESGDDDK